MPDQSYHSFSDFPFVAHQSECISPLSRNLEATLLEAQVAELEPAADSEIPVAQRREALRLQLFTYIARHPDSYMKPIEPEQQDLD